MKFPEEHKRVWWYISLAVLAIILVNRWSAISTGNSTDFDEVLLVFIAALVVIPFFSEFSFLGLSFKKELEQTKQELRQEYREQILNLRAELQNTVNFSSNVNPQFFLTNNPPPDSMLGTIKEEIRSAVIEANRDLNFDQSNRADFTHQVTEAATIAFASRYQIEKEIRRIWRDFFREPAPARSIMLLAQQLVRAGVIPEGIAHSIREVSRVASPAIHAEQASDEQIEFLKDVVPPLLLTLQEIEPPNSSVVSNGW